MRERRVKCLSPAGFHDMAYVEWGDPANPRVLVCVHGLTRCGRDFDFLAERLSGEVRVVCPDVAGRGASDWLANKSLYAIPQYCADMTTLLARLDVESVDWLGTSMGGLIGMTLAAQPNSPIARLLLNDVGPVLSAGAISRIGEYVGRMPRFADIGRGEAWLRVVLAPFGALSDAQWRHLAVHSLRRADDGQWEPSYDPGIAEPFRAAMQGEAGAQDATLWPLYDAIRCPTRVVRGAQSDLLRAEVAAEMATRGPRARTVEIPGVGHAPVFMDEMQVGVVRDFLLG
ncbi:MAG: alpha/beta hydrolase [Sulfurisoma sp.]|nr:alpha/beta hydrolase [Sulfurisoma sp.]